MRKKVNKKITEVVAICILCYNMNCRRFYKEALMLQCIYQKKRINF